jgi:hypothetical protein
MEAYGIHLGVFNLLRFTFGRLKVDGSHPASADPGGGRPNAAPRPPVIELRDRDGVWVDISSASKQDLPSRSFRALSPTSDRAAFTYDEKGAQVVLALTKGLCVDILV